MLLLTATTDVLQVTTAAAYSLDWTASYVDITSTTFTPGSAQGNIAAAATTTVVGAPAASTQRQLKFLSLRNKDATNTQTVTVVKQAASGSYSVTASIALRAGEMLTYVDGEGFRAFDVNGAMKVDSTVAVFSEYLSYVAAAGASNNVAPANFSSVIGQLDVDTTAGVANFTGLTAGADGQSLVVTPIGANALTLNAENAGSSAANQFRLPADMTLEKYDSIRLRYSAAVSKWCMA